MTLLCPVRDCHLPLTREPARVFCPKGHSFDRAKSGYFNLLQPQERRSKLPGDTTQAVAARRRLHDRGVTAPLLKSILEFAQPAGNVLDVGCGEGFYLASFPQISGCGIDISTAAIEAAARRYPACEWIVANADRFIPYADCSFDTLLSITARMNPSEFHRVLKPRSTLLIAIPAPDDLIELRGRGKDRAARTAAEFAPLFGEPTHQRATTTADLDAEAVNDVLHSIYRPLRAEPPRAMSLTFSLDLLLFRNTYMQ